MRRLVLACAIFVACLPTHNPLEGDDAGPPPNQNLNGDDAGKLDVDLGDPFAIQGLDPSHGPFTGGTHTIIAGRGFTSSLRVFVAGTEVPASDVFASDPTRAAITTPPGPPGLADVKVRNDSSAEERTLAQGFLYDAIALTPTTGATTGGTRLAILGSGTTWSNGTTVTIDGLACTNVSVTDATHLQCTTPGDTPGAKDVVVTDASQSSVQAREAFTYDDSPDGYRGGLTGGALAGNLKVLILDAWTGFPIPGATAIVGSDAPSALVHKTDASGAASFSDAGLTGAVTVTAAEKCHQPLTFVDVPVDTVTAYLSPVLSVACASGDPQTVSGTPRDVGDVQGELIFPSGIEFQTRGDWVGVPKALGPSERRAAYVFVGVGDPLQPYYQPDSSTATTEQSPGAVGYGYSLNSYPGDVTLYALAGIETTTSNPAKFMPWVMGVVRGVPVVPKTETTNVDIKMNLLLDHAVKVTPVPPPTTYRGPNRLETQVALTLSDGTYGVLPNGDQVTLLPTSSTLSLVGLPALDGALTGESYALSASAATGPNMQAPGSVLAHVLTNDGNDPIALTGFVPVPVLGTPGSGQWDGKTVSFQESAPVDLVLANVSTGGGLVTWSIVSPGKTSFTVPDLGAIDATLALAHGTIGTEIYVARIDGFSYASLRSGQLATSAWSAYAFDVAGGAY
ncbi:MAG TPA: IPT/TIG domain-containing protein [Polyangiaceae bacterium]|jgi:hypothetical protein